MNFLACPMCNSERVRRSHTRGLKERWLKKLGYRAFRCHEKDCGWRGLIQTESPQEKIKEFISYHKPTLICLGIVVGSVLVFVPLLLYAIK